MKAITRFALILLLVAVQKQDLTSYFSNPNLMSNYLSYLNTPIPVACQVIPGIGQPILAINLLLKSIASAFDTLNQNTSVKVIFYKENECQENQCEEYITEVKIVIMIKTFSSTNYLAIEGSQRNIGLAVFDITTYYLDSCLENIKMVLNEYLIDPNGFVNCGNIKSVFNNVNAINNTNKVNNQSTTSSNTNVSNNNINPAMLAQVIKLLQNN